MNNLKACLHGDYQLKTPTHYQGKKIYLKNLQLLKFFHVLSFIVKHQKQLKIMKHIFSKVALLVLFAVSASHVNAQRPTMKLCLKDNCGYKYNVQFTNNGSDTYGIVGTVDVGNGNTWALHGWLNTCNDSLEYTIVNPNPGQGGLADSCMYCGHGCGFHDQNRNGNVVFEGTGYWVAFDNGQVVDENLFSVRDCDHEAAKMPMKNPGRKPAQLSMTRN